MTRFKDKIVVVTGGASGIGFHSAKLFAAEGAVVAINDCSPDGAQAAVKSIEEQGGRAMAIPGDVADVDQVRANVRKVISRYGRIDILVNNAGIISLAPFSEVKVEDWRRVLAVNLDGVFFWAQCVVVESMIPNKAGVIVNVSSAAGLAGIPSNVAYVASKHGVVGLTKALAVELGRYNIRVNAICPGATETDLVKRLAAKDPGLIEGRRQRIPLGRVATCDDQAHAILFLASPEAASVHGLIMSVDGGSIAMHSGYSVPG